jgi:hypothetical protein
VQLLSDVEFIKGNKQVIFAVCLTPHYHYLGLHEYEQFDETEEMFPKHVIPPSLR